MMISIETCYYFSTERIDSCSRPSGHVTNTHFLSKRIALQHLLSNNHTLNSTFFYENAIVSPGLIAVAPEKNETFVSDTRSCRRGLLMDAGFVQSRLCHQEVYHPFLSLLSYRHFVYS